MPRGGQETLHSHAMTEDAWSYARTRSSSQIEGLAHWEERRGRKSLFGDAVSCIRGAFQLKKKLDARSQLRVNTQMVGARASGAVRSVGGFWIAGKQGDVAEVTCR